MARKSTAPPPPPKPVMAPAVQGVQPVTAQVAAPPKTRAPADFSPQAVARAVLHETLQKPYVLYPTAVGLLGGLAALLLGPSTLFIAPAAVGLGLGLGSWAVDYALRRDKHAADYLRRLHEAMAGRAKDTIERLHYDFSQLHFQAGAAQLEQLEAKFATFESVLRGKLDERELTFSRYQGMAEQVFLGGLDNLARIADTLRGLGAIDQSHASDRLKQLRSDGIESAAQDREIAALEQRLDLQQRQSERIDNWLAENEAAMTQIDQVMAALADLDTHAGHAQVSLDAAMQELKLLAERAQRYSSS